MASTDRIELSPFFDPLRDGRASGWMMKTGIALGLGGCYVLLQYVALPDKEVFTRDYCWVLGLLISATTAALFGITHLLRRMLGTIFELEIDFTAIRGVMSGWLTDRNYLLCGIGFGVLALTVATLLGLPLDLRFTWFSLGAIYCGITLAGFAAGMGLLEVVAIIVLYLRLAPALPHSLNPGDPDGTGGIRPLGDTLWYIAGMIAVVGVLLSSYMLSVDWANLTNEFVQLVFLSWLSLPYILAISVVLIPGLAVRRHISYFKFYKEQQLKQEKARLYAAYRKFADSDDAAIISEKKELSAKMNAIQRELEDLKNMRNSHIDG